MKEIKNVTMGDEHPGIVMDTAKRWNQSLVENLRLYVSLMYAHPLDWIGDDNVPRLAAAARELANDWWPFAQNSLLVIDPHNPTKFCFNTVISDADIENINAHPENWALAVISVE